MPSIRQLFLQHVAQTSRMPLMLEVDRAEGMYIYDKAGKPYMDLNSGICVSALGHCHPSVVEAVRQQAATYMHTMVYGEHVQSPQVKLATALSDVLPERLDSVYFVNSGTEAVEGAMKLAKRYTGRYEVVAARNAYHGSTQGAESLRSDGDLTHAFRPLVPGIRHITFNALDDLAQISRATACVILECVQGEAGVILPARGFLQAVRKRCDEVGALLVFDEIQTGFGRMGSLFACQKFDCTPDILTLGKAMGGGMPMAAFVSSREIMTTLTDKPTLGHITTFGGHPVCCAAALAALQKLVSGSLIADVEAKAALFKRLLRHGIIREVRQAGLMMAVELTRKRYMKHVVGHAFERGALVDWFLFNQKAFRLAPPLIITAEEIEEACGILLEACDYASEQ